MFYNRWLWPLIGVLFLSLLVAISPADATDNDVVVTTLAGSAGVTGAKNGDIKVALFDAPNGIAVDSSGNIYITEFKKPTIRKITPGGKVRKLSLSSNLSEYPEGIVLNPGDNILEWPEGITLNRDGNIFVEDRNTILEISPKGVIRLLAGSPNVTGTRDGMGKEAEFITPKGLAVNGSGDIYVTDFGMIRKITPEGVVTTIAGSKVKYGARDGTGKNALLHEPYGVGVDPSGDLYIVDRGTDLVQKVTPEGVVTTLAGSAGVTGCRDGMGKEALFNEPSGLAVDAFGNIYVADTDNDTIRKVTPEGLVITLAGTPGKEGYRDGVGNEALFNEPWGVAVDSSGNVYVADSGNDLIRKITQVKVKMK